MTGLTPQAIQLLNALAGAGNSVPGYIHKQRDIPNPTGPYMHGPGGLFNIPGAEQDIISTRLIPSGLGTMIPARGTNTISPEYLYITGFKAGTGSDPVEECDDAREAGPIMNCTRTAKLGIQQLQTRSFNINREGDIEDRSEPFDFRIVNDPIVPALGQLIAPSTADISIVRALGSEVLMRFLELGQEMQETLMPMLYTGNPSNNLGPGTKQFPGLDLLIGSNAVDKDTGTPCPSLYSLVEDNNYADVTSNAGTDMVDQLASIFYRLNAIRSKTRMGTVRWVIAMRAGAFRAMTQVWPCTYMTSFCQFTNTQAVVNVDGGDMVSMRDDMRNNQYLLIDGVRYDVVIDDSIPEGNATGGAIDSSTVCYSSDIYIVPLTVRGGYEVLYWEYKDYSKGAMRGAANGRYDDGTFWTDGGVFLWVRKPNRNWCIQFQVKTEPRLILLTPHLAARILNVSYCYDHERDTMKNHYNYVGGGVENRPEKPVYGEWATSTPALITA